MASSLASPFRRFLHSTSCARVVVSSARSSPTASERPTVNDPDELEEEPEHGRLNQLTDLLDSVAQQPHDYSEPSPTVVRFTEGRLIRPIDLHRDLHKLRPLGRKRANLGPGREARYNDIFLQLGIDPRLEADNLTLMSNFATRLGRIQTRNVTGLSQRSQRLIGKAIKRAKMMGVIPVFSNGKMKDLTHDSGSHVPRPPNSDRKDRSNFSGR